MVARIAELQGHSIAVAAVDRNGDIASSFPIAVALPPSGASRHPVSMFRWPISAPINGIPGRRGIGHEQRHVLGRTDGLRLAGGDEATLSRSTAEHGTGDPAFRHRR